MDTQKAQEFVASIEASNGALRRLLVELDREKDLYPILIPAINDCKLKLWKSMHAVAQLRAEIGLTDQS